MAHIGLTPQSFHVMGGFKTQGLDKSTWGAIEADAISVEKAGAFALVLEGMAEPLASKITKKIEIPTIGIGASPHCDGQILVLEDMLGLSPRVPRVVKEFGQIGAQIEGAVELYASEVRSRQFPGEQHVYKMKDAPVAPLGKSKRKQRTGKIKSK